MHHRTKHMDIRYHYIRECTNPQPGQLLPRARMQYDPTNYMSADVMTKALVRKLFQLLETERCLGLRQLSEPALCRTLVSEWCLV